MVLGAGIDVGLRRGVDVVEARDPKDRGGHPYGWGRQRARGIGDRERCEHDERYLTYARLDADLARNAAPWVAFGNLSSPDLFSARMGCQTYGVYGVDLAALCIKNKTP
jgi:hypothetical protein